MYQMYRTRTVMAGKNRYTEHGLFCEKCNSFLHVYFMSEELEREREKVSLAFVEFNQDRNDVTNRKWKFQKQVYDKKFEEFNRRVRRKLNMPLDSHVVWKTKDTERELLVRPSFMEKV